jgi:hypothetical protein
MSARRRYTIECDGPNCEKAVVTQDAFVEKARKTVANNFMWWKIGHSDQVGSHDFCSRECEEDFKEAQ